MKTMFTGAAMMIWGSAIVGFQLAARADGEGFLSAGLCLGVSLFGVGAHYLGRGVREERARETLPGLQFPAE